MRKSLLALSLVLASPWACSNADAPKTEGTPAAEQRIAGPATRAEKASEASAGPAADGAQDGDAKFPAGAADDRGTGSFVGTVEGSAFVPTHSFFMRGHMQVPGEPEAIILVQTDNADLCAHLAAGTMPKNATMFAVALINAEYGPLEAGKLYLAPGSRGRYDALQAMAYFRRLDDVCEITPAPFGGEAELGQAHLHSISASRAKLTYSFALTTGDEIQGTLDAPFCSAPMVFAEPESLTTEVAESACR